MVEIQLDKKRFMSLTIRDVRDTEKLTGIKFHDSLRDPSVDFLVVASWLMLRHEDKNLTLESFESIIETNKIGLLSLAEPIAKCTEELGIYPGN